MIQSFTLISSPELHSWLFIYTNTIKTGALRLKGLLRQCAIGKHLWFTLANIFIVKYWQTLTGLRWETLGSNYKHWGARLKLAG